MLSNNMDQLENLIKTVKTTMNNNKKFISAKTLNTFKDEFKIVTYQTRKNEANRTIYLLRTDYLQQYLNDMKKIMYYEKSSQYINKKLIRTENTRVTMP